MFINYQKGEIGRMKVMLRAIEKGLLVSLPVVESRYDLILDDGKSLSRAQVKYCSRKNNQSDGCVGLDLQKDTRNNGKKRSYNSAEVDVILVYIPQVDQIVCLTPDIFNNKRYISLRYNDTKNNQSRGVFLIKDYLW